MPLNDFDVLRFEIKYGHIYYTVYKSNCKSNCDDILPSMLIFRVWGNLFPRNVNIFGISAFFQSGHILFL